MTWMLYNIEPPLTYILHTISYIEMIETVSEKEKYSQA